jgi:SAM-dependent methyltransferase
MNQYREANRALWDTWTGEHEGSAFYDVAGFKAGRDPLRSIESSELGDVRGRSLLHLQCHFGMDTLAWARRGAAVTGVDLSEKSIELARALSRELELPAEFICSDVYDLPNRLTSRFDIVYCSYGVLHWLHDLRPWGRIIADFLRPGGIFYIVEDHPTFRMFTTVNGTQMKLANPYFFSSRPERIQLSGSYANDFKGEPVSGYMWNHGLGDVLNALIDGGLTIEFLHEYPFAPRAKFPFMERAADGWWHLPSEYVQIPFLFSLQARKPGRQA